MLTLTGNFPAHPRSSDAYAAHLCHIHPYIHTPAAPHNNFLATANRDANRNTEPVGVCLSRATA